jgi:hypothetical protein
MMKTLANSGLQVARDAHASLARAEIASPSANALEMIMQLPFDL